MNRTLSATIFTGMLAFGMQVLAADPPPDPAAPSSAGQMTQDPSSSKPMSKSQKAFMKDCMTKAKAANNGMSEVDMKKSCKDQLKADQPDKAVTPAH